MNNSPVMVNSKKTHEEDIYEDLCYITLRSNNVRHHTSSTSSTTSIATSASPSSLLFVPIEKRDYCLRELVETEKNYCDALNMIIRHFVIPLKKVIRPQDSDIIFKHIKQLADTHSVFHRDLVTVCYNSSHRDSHRLSSCFLRYKDKFVIYGDYCVNLPRAQARIDDLCTKDETISKSVTRQQLEANDGKFKLRDLLSLPMQRILKYHLLLKELIKNTIDTHEDWYGLQRAYEAMIDIGDYINEVKRDSESLQIIAGIENSIVDLEMPENVQFKDYGRLVNDGHLRIQYLDDKIKSRYVFAFEKVLLMCKQSKNQYNFKDGLILADFQIEDSPLNGAALTTQTSTGALKHFKDKWSHHWYLVHHTEKYSYAFYAKSELIKRKWIESLSKALDNVYPQACRNNLTDHIFIITTFDSPTVCCNCDKLLRGLFFQGFKCSACGISVHKDCISSARCCEALKLPAKPPLPYHSPTLSATRLSSIDESFIEKSEEPRKVRALAAFIGESGSDEVTFDVNDSIVVFHERGFPIEKKGDWLFGKVLRTEQEGIFPAELVTDVEISNKMYEDTVGGSSGKFSDILAQRLNALDAYVNLNLDEYPWFAGTMDRASAQSLLEKLPNSTFLVRISPKQKGNYAISLNCHGLVKHMRICVTPNRKYFLSESKFFDSVIELVAWYEEHSLAESFFGLKMTLTIPYKNVHVSMDPISYAIADYDFTANSSNLLTIKKGDRIAIISKAGQEKGWWKGQIEQRIGYFPYEYVTELRE